MISNDQIADIFSLLAKLMDIHGENSFKIKSYSIAAYTLEKLPQPIAELPPEKFTAIKGIGDAIGKKIQEIITSGELRLLNEYIQKTPPGIIEMLEIKGLGPKKIATIWREMEIESIGELLYACQENRLLLFKGFGAKTQQNVLDSIEFFLKSQGSHLYAEVAGFANTLLQDLQNAFPDEKLSFTGAFRRQLEVIDQLEWVTTVSPASLQATLGAREYTLAAEPSSGVLSSAEPSSGDQHHVQHIRSAFRSPEGVRLDFIHTSPSSFITTLFQTSCSADFLGAWQDSANPDLSLTKAYSTEEELFEANGIHYIPTFRREQRHTLEQAARQPLARPLETADIKGIIHSHSTWSDGSNTLEEMAKACIEKGFEYLVISDHSKSAGYANGLKEDRIREQHIEIDELNRKLAPFHIFKSIECDILTDGTLDYTNDILSTFDLVITSVHSNLKMTEDKAMMRLLRAIENQYTTILGHMTGRLLLSRPGYPVDHKKVIDACAANKVVIEFNAHPRRLDMDWRWISYALEKGVMMSVDPDAHSVQGYDVIHYGVLSSRKGGLTADRNLSSFSLAQLRAYLESRRR
jgi:DNA polymerase (family 10)